MLSLGGMENIPHINGNLGSCLILCSPYTVANTVSLKNFNDLNVQDKELFYHGIVA